jgi:hypothetical protein
MGALGIVHLLILAAIVIPGLVGVAIIVLVMFRAANSRPGPDQYPCPDCGGMVSPSALVCPQCGRPLR